MATSEYKYARVTAWVDIAGEKLPLVGVNIDYELNAIPRCQCRLPVGRDVRSGKASAVHDFIAGLTAPVVIKVYAHFEVDADSAGSSIITANEDILLFEGESAGVGFSRTTSAMQFTLQGRHWLGALEEGSILSASSAVSNPGRYTLGALDKSVGESGARDWGGLAGAGTLITHTTIRRDFWGSALHPWFTALAKTDPFWVESLAIKPSTPNSRVSDALDRMKPSSDFDKLSISDEIVDSSLAGSIANDISLITKDPEQTAHQTFWDVLVGACAPEYLFAVVPRISDALVVPYIPAYRTPYLTIPISQLTSVEISRPASRRLRGFGLMAGLTPTTGLDGVPGGEGKPGIAGYYDSKLEGGVVRIEVGPRWTTQLLVPSDSAAESSGAKGVVISTADRPEAGASSPAPLAAKTRNKTVIRPLLDRYAQARYAAEALRGRMGSISGPFRQDIAPGSTVRIETAGEAFIAEDAASAAFVGTVVRVSMSLDAENRSAATSFQLAYIRSDAENLEDATSIASHPLYIATYSGASLARTAE